MMTRARTRRFTAALGPLAFLLLIAFAAWLPCSAQIVGASGDQAPAVPSGDHPLIGTATEQVNPANCQIQVQIPIPVPAGRGPQVNFSIDYNSGSAAHLIWDAGLPTPALAWADNKSVIGAAGWSYALPLLTYNYHTLDYTGQGGKIDTCYVLTDFVLQNVDGDQQLGISPVQESNGNICPTVPAGTRAADSDRLSERAQRHCPGSLLAVYQRHLRSLRQPGARATGAGGRRERNRLFLRRCRPRLRVLG